MQSLLQEKATILQVAFKQYYLLTGVTAQLRSALQLLPS
jgi:hypothetical protein